MTAPSRWNDYIIPSAALPAGFDCVASFVAKERPGILDWLTEAPEDAFMADEASLLRISSALALPVHYVEPSAAYRRAGHARQPAFQVGLVLGLAATFFSLERSFFGKQLNRRRTRERRGNLASTESPTVQVTSNARRPAPAKANLAP